LALVATVVYGIFVALAVVWLYLRDRSEVLPERAIGDFGAFVSLAIGAGVGGALSLAILWLGRYLAPFRALEARLGEAVGPLTESEILLIAMTSAIGEELLFRGALQDWVGPYFTALVFGLLHTGPGLKLWGVSAGVMGLCFGLMVESRCGLLSVIVAHALVNFISLRRMALQ
jgi:hypothetical protein